MPAAETATTLKLARELIARRSITPEDGGCQELLAARLARRGFASEPVRSGEVANLWARRGDVRPLLCFVGHTDVVPPGPLDQWHIDPFAPTEREGKLFGLVAADMKTSIAAFVVAAEHFVAKHPSDKVWIAILITSDEEVLAVNGTAKGSALLSGRAKAHAY